VVGNPNSTALFATAAANPGGTVAIPGCWRPHLIARNSNPGLRVGFGMTVTPFRIVDRGNQGPDQPHSA
jgi:hypothetical protein